MSTAGELLPDPDTTYPGNSKAAKGRPEETVRPDAILLTTDFPPQLGGIAEYLAGLWREAALWGSSTVYSTARATGESSPQVPTLPRPPERRLGERRGDDIPVARRINTLLHFRSLRRYARLTVAAALSRVDERSRVCIGVWSPLAHFWCEALAGAGQPYALFAHGLDVIQPLYSTVAPWRQADFRRASRVIVNSAGTARMAVEKLGLEPARLRVVNPGIEVAGYRPPSPESVAKLRAALDLGADPVALSVGRLVRRKGFDSGLRAFAAYRVRGGAGTYVIAGDGPERTALDALARELGLGDSVRFVGAVDEPTKLALYELCDVFVMPNSLLANVDWEGFGIVFLEAARAGKPALGGANGGVPDAVVDGVTGLLVDSGDQRAVNEALATLLRDGTLRARLGVAARRRAEREIDWASIGERFRGVLGEAW
jgi:phosphatidylinositol alpha-1,6-mannosyltransferase